MNSLENAFKNQKFATAHANDIDNAENYREEGCDSNFQLVKNGWRTPGVQARYGPGICATGRPRLMGRNAACVLVAIIPYWGANRSLAWNSATLTQPGPPVAYSENSSSDFYR